MSDDVADHPDHRVRELVESEVDSRRAEMRRAADWYAP